MYVWYDRVYIVGGFWHNRQEDTGEMFVPETGYSLGFKTGFTRKSKTPIDMDAEIARVTNVFSKDPAVLQGIRNSGKQFHPPPLE